MLSRSQRYASRVLLSRPLVRSRALTIITGGGRGRDCQDSNCLRTRSMTKAPSHRRPIAGSFRSRTTGDIRPIWRSLTCSDGLVFRVVRAALIRSTSIGLPPSQVFFPQQLRVRFADVTHEFSHAIKLE